MAHLSDSEPEVDVSSSESYDDPPEDHDDLSKGNTAQNPQQNEAKGRKIATIKAKLQSLGSKAPRLEILNPDAPLTHPITFKKISERFDAGDRYRLPGWVAPKIKRWIATHDFIDKSRDRQSGVTRSEAKEYWELLWPQLGFPDLKKGDPSVLHDYVDFLKEHYLIRKVLNEGASLRRNSSVLVIDKDKNKRTWCPGIRERLMREGTVGCSKSPDELSEAKPNEPEFDGVEQSVDHTDEVDETLYQRSPARSKKAEAISSSREEEQLVDPMEHSPSTLDELETNSVSAGNHPSSLHSRVDDLQSYFAVAEVIRAGLASSNELWEHLVNYGRQDESTLNRLLDANKTKVRFQVESDRREQEARRQEEARWQEEARRQEKVRQQFKAQKERSIRIDEEKSEAEENWKRRKTGSGSTSRAC